MSERENLIAEAHDLELEFKGNISNVKLAAMIAEAKGLPAPVDEVAPPGPAIKDDPEVTEETTVETTEEVVETTPTKDKNPKKESPAAAAFTGRRKMIADARERAFKTRVVTITNKDSRENEFMTTAYLSFENQHFGLSKLVPLDVAVELEEALIKVAKSTVMTLHKDEIIGGKRTGNKVATTVKKFAISYGE